MFIKIFHSTPRIVRLTIVFVVVALLALGLAVKIVAGNGVSIVEILGLEDTVETISNSWGENLNQSELTSDSNSVEVTDGDVSQQLELTNTIDIQKTPDSSGSSQIDVSVQNGEYDVNIEGDGTVVKEITNDENGLNLHIEYVEESNGSRSSTTVDVSQSSNTSNGN